MPKYDAFGREIGEDPLKSLRDDAPRVEIAATPPEEPVTTASEPEAEPERIATAPPQFVRPRRRRRGGLASLGVIVAIVGVVALVGNSAVEKGQDLVDEFASAIPDVDDAADAAPEPTPVGLESASLIREDNFAAALKTLADSGLGRPTYLRVAAERVDTQLLDGNTLHIVQITPDGALKEFGSSQGTGRPIAYKAIDPGAPERLVRAASNARNPARSIDYLVISPGPPQTVGAYFKRGRIVIGDAHGKPQRVL